MQHPAPPKYTGLTRETARKLDGKLENAMTGAGIYGVDASASTQRRLVVYTAERARREYRQSWAARREIERPAGDMVRGGIELEDLPPGFDAAAIVSALDDIGGGEVPEDTGALAALARLHAEGNKCAGAALVAVLDDDLEPWQPVDLTRIRRLVSLELLERDEITPWRSGAGGPIEYYIIGTARTKITASSIVHASRVILHKGARMSPSEEWINQGWGASVLELLHTERQAMHVAHQEMGTLMLRATMDVVYLAELAERLCGKNGRADIDEQLHLISRARGVHRLIPLDAGATEDKSNEEAARPSDKFESLGRPLQGVAALVPAIENGWAAGTGQTPSIALGRNVGGLNTGANAGDWQSWSSVIEWLRLLWLFPRLDRVIEWLCASKEGPTGGRIPETWKVKMAPLWVPPSKEVAEERYIQAQADEIMQRVSGIAPDVFYEQRQVLGATGELRLDPLPEIDPLLAAASEDASKQALNGAQIQALFELSANVAGEIIPVETALWLVGLAVPGIDEVAARAALEAAAAQGPAEVEPAANALIQAVPPGSVDPALVEQVADAWRADRARKRKWWRRDAKPSPAEALESWRRAWAGA